MSHTDAVCAHAVHLHAPYTALRDVAEKTLR